jgi:hypothetical protein
MGGDGFGVCANDELHGDVEYYYVVEHGAAGTVVRAMLRRPMDCAAAIVESRTGIR